MASPPPAAHIPLTAAEALILLEPTKAQGKAALKLTLLELLGQRLLTVYRQEQRGFLGRRRNIDLLQCAPEATPWVPPRAHVWAVLRALRTSGGSRGIPMKRVVTAMRKAFGADLAGYQTGFVERHDGTAARTAIARLQGQESAGRPLTVNEAKPREPRQARW